MSVLSVANNNDGTVTITISGSNGAEVHYVYRTLFDGLTPSKTPVLVTSGTGDLTITTALAVGHYQFSLMSNLGGVYTIAEGVYQSCSDASVESVYMRILNSAATIVTALGLTGTPGTPVVQRLWMPRHAEGDLPKVLISPAGSESDLSALMQSDDIEYPVIIVTVCQQNQDASKNMTAVLKWRGQIARAFRNKRMPGIPESYNVAVSYDVTADLGAFRENLLFSALMLRVKCRETRGM